MATLQDRTPGSETKLDPAAIDTFKASIRGLVIAPGDADYDTARRVHNGMIERFPRLIVRCRDVADVIGAVNFGRDAGLVIAVRGGAHNAAGLGTVDDGLVIDLSLMRGVRVDPLARTAQVEGGAVWGDVDHATSAFGLATPSGFISTTGVGGLTLGGGIGNLTRGYGLTIDNLLAVDMVLANGSFVTASPDRHADLFWAVRGGGGNFGIVTAFVFRLHPIGSAGTVYAGPMLWPMEQAAEMLRWWRDFMRGAPGNAWRLVRVPEGAAGSALSHRVSHPHDGRHRVDLYRTRRRRRGNLRADPPRASSGDRLRRSAALPRPPEHVRRPGATRHSVVLARRFPERDQRCGDSSPRRARSPVADVTEHHAHLSDRRRRASRWPSGARHSATATPVSRR